MRLTFTDGSAQECERLFELDALPPFGGSIDLGNGVTLRNATPEGARLLECVDVTVILQFSMDVHVSLPDAASEAADFARSVGAGLVASWLYDKLSGFVKRHPKKLVIDGEIVADEERLREELAASEELPYGR